MDKILIDKWNERNVQVKNAITALLEEDGYYITYPKILKVTLKAMFEDDYDEYYGYPNYENIHVIDDGDYQGMLLFIVPEYAINLVSIGNSLFFMALALIVILCKEFLMRMMIKISRLKI